MKYKLLRLVFWILLVTSVFSTPFSFSWTLNFLITITGTVLCLFVLFGYAYKKPIFHPAWWKLAFYANLLIWARAIYRSLEKAVALGWGTLDIGLFLMVSGAFGLAILSMHFVYAFRSNEIWAQFRA